MHSACTNGVPEVAPGPGAAVCNALQLRGTLWATQRPVALLQGPQDAHNAALRAPAALGWPALSSSCNLNAADASGYVPGATHQRESGAGRNHGGQSGSEHSGLLGHLLHVQLGADCGQQGVRGQDAAGERLAQRCCRCAGSHRAGGRARGRRAQLRQEGTQVSRRPAGVGEAAGCCAARHVPGWALLATAARWEEATTCMVLVCVRVKKARMSPHLKPIEPRSPQL